VLSNLSASLILVGGVLLSALMAALVFVLGTSRRKALELVAEKTRELSHRALHDGLTGLPNRVLVLDRAAQMLARARRDPGLEAGALFIDIDGFKQVNDRHGHPAGDLVLRAVAERLAATLRAQDTVGRIGGDEFVVLAESTGQSAALELIAERIVEALRAPLALPGGAVISVSASVGLAQGRYDTAEELLRDADRALYRAKAAGKDRYAVQSGLGA
jgi:diguanylate cyclase (GGDEF)-like protein